MKKGYPKEVVIDELLGRACRELSRRTGERYCLALDAEAQVIQAVRLRDNFKTEFEAPPYRPVGHGSDAVAETLLKLRFDEVLSSITLAHKAEVSGVKDDEGWRNQRGKPYATLKETGVTVHQHDTVRGYGSPRQWSFYVGDSRVLQVSKELLGDQPSVPALMAAWEAFASGLLAGERLGIKDGRKALKRELHDLLAVEADPDFTFGIMSRDEAIQRFGQDWRKVIGSIDALRVEKDGTLTSVPAGA